MPEALNHPSRSHRESYGRRRPMPPRVREGRQETLGRKRPLREAPETMRDEGTGEDEGEQAKDEAVVRHRLP